MVEATVDVFMTHVSFESFRAVMSFVDTHEKSKAKGITFSYTLHRSITKNKLQNFFCLKQNTEDSKQQKNTSFDTTENYTVWSPRDFLTIECM